MKSHLGEEFQIDLDFGAVIGAKVTSENGTDTSKNGTDFGSVSENMSCDSSCNYGSSQHYHNSLALNNTQGHENKDVSKDETELKTETPNKPQTTKGRKRKREDTVEGVEGDPSTTEGHCLPLPFPKKNKKKKLVPPSVCDPISQSQCSPCVSLPVLTVSAPSMTPTVPTQTPTASTPVSTSPVSTPAVVASTPVSMTPAAPTPAMTASTPVSMTPAAPTPAMTASTPVSMTPAASAPSLITSTPITVRSDSVLTLTSSSSCHSVSPALLEMNSEDEAMYCSDSDDDLPTVDLSVRDSIPRKSGVSAQMAKGLV